MAEEDINVTSFYRPVSFENAVFKQIDRVNMLISEHRKNKGSLDDIIFAVETLSRMFSAYWDEYYFIETKEIETQIVRIQKQSKLAEEEKEYMRLIFRKMNLIYRMVYSLNLSPGKMLLPVILHKGTTSYEKFFAKYDNTRKPDSQENTTPVTQT